MKRFHHQLQDMEHRLFHPVGLYIAPPQQQAYLFLEIRSA